jgi:hypothetical protein
MSRVVLPKAALAAMRKYDTPTICNVIELFDVRPRNTGYMDRRIKACFPERLPENNFDHLTRSSVRSTGQ